MSLDNISPLLEWLNANPNLAGLAVFIISAGESIAIIGTIVPGTIMMAAIGTVTGAGIIPFWSTMLWAIAGAILGDGISYWMGHYFKGRLPSIWPFRKYPGFLEKGERFVHKYGVMGVFIGRFAGPVRALVPLVAGMMGMKPAPFTIANVTSAILWAPAYMLPGIIIGAASQELPPDIAMNVVLVLVLLSLLILLSFWFVFEFFRLIRNQIERGLNHLWLVLKESRYFSTITIVLKHHDPEQHHGQLTLAFYFLLTSFLTFLLAFYVKLAGAENIAVNDTAYHLFRGIRTEMADKIMIALTLLGQKQVILTMVAALFAYLLFSKRWRAAIHALALAVLASGSVFIIKRLVESTRPWGIFNGPETYSMPSGHATLSATIYMGIAFILANTLNKKWRWMIYAPAIILILMIGISRLYLGAHWFTDILCGWLISISLLILVILSYHRQREKNFNILAISTVCITSLLAAYLVFYYLEFTQFITNYAQIQRPTLIISESEWWQKNENIPEFHVSLFGIPSQPINIEWVGHLDQIKQNLMAEGWEIPPSRDWISTLHRITDIKSAQYLPLIPPQYLDKNPVLLLTREINGGRKTLVLRLWGSQRTIKENQHHLWVGTIGLIPRSYSWIFKRQTGAVDAKPQLLFSKQKASQHWEWKMITIHRPNGKNPMEQNILLIKPKNKSMEQAF